MGEGEGRGGRGGNIKSRKGDKGNLAEKGGKEERKQPPPQFNPQKKKISL